MGNFSSNWARRRTDAHLRLALLGGVSLIAWGIVVVRAPSAHAEQDPSSTASTVNSNGTGIYVAPNVDLTGSPGINNNTITGTIYSQGTIDSGGFGVVNFGTIGVLTNAGGTITGHSNGVFNESGSISTLSNSGLISSTGANARGVQNQGGTIGVLTNSGTITGTSGIAAQTGIGTIINEYGGTISSSNGQDYGIYANAHIDLLDNQSGGTISGATGILVQSHDISTLINSGVITGEYGVFTLDGTIGHLANAGTIYGATEAVTNDDLIGTLTNTGTILGATGVYNSGHIGTLANESSGTINGLVSSAIYNSGTIGTLSNSGHITSTVTDGIAVENVNTIGQIYNNGTIQGDSTGIANLAHIGTIDNQAGGLITATHYAIDNAGTIGHLGNAANAAITASTTGIYNDGHIGTLTNNGTITADYAIVNDTAGTDGTLINTGLIDGYTSGIVNYGLIHTLTNSGLIEAGTSAIYNRGQIDTLTNSGNISGEYGIVNGDYEGTIGTIGAVTNTGTIVGYEDGLVNAGSIGALTNSGTIYGIDTAGIGSDGYIGTLANLTGGTIAGHEVGVGNAGSIINFTNYGLIEATATTGSTIAAVVNIGAIDSMTNESGGTMSGYDEGIYNAGTITGLDNSGLIETTSNGEGIYNTYNGTIGSLSNEAGGTISGYYDGIYNDGGISTLTNSGLIESTYDDDGIFNDGSIGALTNFARGVVSGPSTGIFNDYLISSLTNFGMITGGTEGLYNYSFATIGAVTNSGTISGGDFGIYNDGFAYNETPYVALVQQTIAAYSGFIGTINNSGLISGGETGIYNQGSIGVIVNTGTITGALYDGIYNSGALYDYNSETARAQAFASSTGFATGSISSLTNNGLISGGFAGIANEGYIGSINNTGEIFGSIYGIYNGYAGTITTETLAADTTATEVPAYIGQITNTGTISGLTGIYLTGGGTTITNSGTIASTDGGNAIYFGGVNDLILTTGAVIDGTITGGGTASQIALEGNGSLDNTIANFGEGSNLAVTPGADWTATGSWTIADVTNDGVFQPGRLGTPLTLTGDYLQNADGTMRVLVTPTTSTQFNITGSATLSGTVTYVLAPGHYSPHIYPYLTATDGVTGEFTTVNYGEIPKGLAATQYIDDPVVQLVLSGSFNIPNIINPTDSTIFSAQTQALAQGADADTGSLLEKAAYGGAATSPACAAEAPLSPNKTGASGTGANMASALASVFCGAGGWIEATGSLGHADPSGGAPSYNANTAGFLAGVDKVLDPSGTRLGFAVGYDETYLSDKLGGGGRMGTTRVALYGAQPLGMFTLAGVLEYGNANNTTSRVSGDGNLSENNSVSIWSGGLQISTDLVMHGIDFVPAAGLRVASVGGGSHFAESASGIAAAFAVSGKTTQYNSVQPYVLVEGKRNFYTASGVTLTPDAEIGYEYEADTHGIVTTLVGQDGTVFYTPHNDLDPSDALLSAGISASKKNWSLFVTYTAHVSGNWDTQMGEAGLRITF